MSGVKTFSMTQELKVYGVSAPLSVVADAVTVTCEKSPLSPLLMRL